MRIVRPAVRTLAVLLLCVSPLAAQQASPAPGVGIAIGLWDVPGPLHPGCNPPSLQYPGVETHAEVVTGRAAFQGVVGISGFPAHNFCLPDVYIPPDGIHTSRVRVVESRVWRAHGELRTRWKPDASPVSAHGGIGVMAPGAVPYLMGGAALHLRIGLPVHVQASRRWMRLPWDHVTREWDDGRVVREIDRERVHDRWSGWIVRIGMDLPVP